ncbi:hypothetical protein KIH27_02025 [Mycobacterium sp. M1]|uniref:Uncharacterized protein n=1 Tax=Mycolicibacter acidiphilus TaxID=2835306 RepID=A0ABS5REH2_9MYCO|nr:hypothetical protein [Mycolicibacter acidiphilus]MBS9532362.1 hypothetical protein [Mycolicibacter acidiphilus]
MTTESLLPYVRLTRSGTGEAVVLLITAHGAERLTLTAAARVAGELTETVADARERSLRADLELAVGTLAGGAEEGAAVAKTQGLTPG